MRYPPQTLIVVIVGEREEILLIFEVVEFVCLSLSTSHHHPLVFSLHAFPPTNKQRNILPLKNQPIIITYICYHYHNTQFLKPFFSLRPTQWASKSLTTFAQSCLYQSEPSPTAQSFFRHGPRTTKTAAHPLRTLQRWFVHRLPRNRDLLSLSQQQQLFLLNPSFKCLTISLLSLCFALNLRNLFASYLRYHFFSSLLFSSLLFITPNIYITYNYISLYTINKLSTASHYEHLFFA